MNEPQELQSFINPQSTNERMIWVTSPYQGKGSTIGKAAFIEALTGKPPVTVKHNDLSLELGRLSLLDDKSLLLLGISGRVQLRLLYNTLLDYLIGMIIVFNSSWPEQFREVRSIQQSLNVFPDVPKLYVADIHHPENSWEEPDIRTALRLAPEDRLMKCNAYQRHQTANTILKLIEPLPYNNYLNTLQNTLHSL